MVNIWTCAIVAFETDCLKDNTKRKRSLKDIAAESADKDKRRAITGELDMEKVLRTFILIWT